MQAIIRFSVDNDNGSKLRNKLAGVLSKAGFSVPTKSLKIVGVDTNTSTYRHRDINPSDMADTLKKFWSAAGKHDKGGTLDHFWMYSDCGFLSDGADVNGGEQTED